MENVILSPHALAWTDDLYEMNGTIACQSLLAVFRGELPAFPVNLEVIEQVEIPGETGRDGGAMARVWGLKSLERAVVDALASPSLH